MRLQASYNQLFTDQYSFQAQEHDDELKGDGNSVNYKYRMYDSRLGRFFAVDPLASKYSYNSPYAFSENVVIDHIELEGLEKADIKDLGFSNTSSSTNSSSNKSAQEAFANSTGKCENCFDLLLQKTKPKTTSSDVSKAPSGGAVMKPISEIQMQRNQQNYEVYKQQEMLQNSPLNDFAKIGQGLPIGAKVVAETVIIEASVIKAVSYASKFKTFCTTTTVFRSVSAIELADATQFGLRTTEGGYETSKLFAPTLGEASEFGRINYQFDGAANHILKVQVPNRIYKESAKFTADGMNAIAIPSDQLHKLMFKPLNFSPLK